MELKEIKAIIDLMTKHGLTEFELQKDDVKIRLKRGTEGATHSVVPVENGGNGLTAFIPAPASPPAASAAAQFLPASVPPSVEIKEIKSPMVGTFYRSASPDAAPFVEVGQAVKEDTVVCIIEAMKVMNEIKAEMKGVITEVLVENGKPVEFGKPLFRLKVG